MRSWFGSAAGPPGTRFEVQFSRSHDGWWIAPLGKVLPARARGQLVAYPRLRAAAGAAAEARPDEPTPEDVTLPFDAASDDVFAVRATGDSMNGGKSPIGDGDWLVMLWARGAGLGSRAGRVALVQTPDGHDGFAYPVKRIVQNAERWWLRSDNPERPSLEASTETTPIAQLVATIRPETLGPAIGERLAADEIGAAFGLASATLLERTARYEGHLFVVITDEGHFTEPDRLQTIITDRRPGETAFVLARPTAGAPFRYCGVARSWSPTDPGACPRSISRPGAPSAEDGNARAASPPPPSSEPPPSSMRSCGAHRREPGWRVTESAAASSNARTAADVRIDGGDGGFAPRQVTATDLAWVMLAAQAVTEGGGLLDEARVNRLRYLDGTPKGSTRGLIRGGRSRCLRAL